MKHGLDTSFLIAVEVAGHKDHHVARGVAESLRRKGDRFVIAPQVLAEFMHVVTDPRRFSAPLTMDQALRRAEVWWNSNEVDWALPDEGAVTWFLKAMREERLGPHSATTDRSPETLYHTDPLGRDRMDDLCRDSSGFMVCIRYPPGPYFFCTPLFRPRASGPRQKAVFHN